MAARPRTTPTRPPVGQTDPSEQRYPTEGEDDPQPVPPAATGHRRDPDRAEELDRDRGSQRQVLDGDVETEVHRRQHHAETGRGQ